MHPPVSIAKIIPPRFPHILKRPRLLERLERQNDKKLILILGQAAQGKSTLAFSYVSASQVPSAWLNLGPEDSEAVNLFYLLVHSLQQALPEFDLSPLLSYPTLPAGPREELPLYRDWLLTLLNRIQAPVRIVLDGLDRLAPQAPAFRFLQLLLEVAPPHLHLLMLSREMPPLKLRELKVRQEVYLITNEELAFTAKETRGFLQNVRKLLLPYDLMVQINEFTEGWIGGLVLLCEILERLPEESREKFLTEEAAGKFTTEVSGYFEESIFSSRSPKTQDFLLKSSILEVVEPDFVQDYLGVDHARDILEGLSARNLFVQSIFHRQKGWLYRYHQLFKDFLQAKFEETLPPAEKESAYFRAGSLLDQRGDLESAVNFYLQAGALDRAVAAMEQVGYELLEQGKTAELERWLQALPPALVQDRPWLLLYHFLTARFTGSLDSFLNLQRALGLFQQRQDIRGLLLASAYYLEASWFQGASTPTAIALDQADKLLQEVDSQAFPYESAVLWFQVGWAQSLGCNPRAGYQACQKAANLAARAGRRHLQINALIRCRFILTCVGEFTLAQEIGQEVEGLLATWISPELQAWQFLMSGLIAIFQGEIEEADLLINSARQLAVKQGLTFMYPVMQVHRFLILGYQERYAEALELGLNSMDSIFAMAGVVIHGLATWYMSIIHYHRGDFPTAKTYVERGRQAPFAGLAGFDFHFNLLKIVMGLLSCHLQELDPEVERGLEEARQNAAAAGNYLLLPDVYWTLALWRWRQGRGGEAAAHLQAGMQLAARRGTYFSQSLSPRDHGRIFTLALELGVEEVWDQLPPLLSRWSEWVGPDLARLSRHHNPKIAAKAGELRLALHREKLPRLDIRTMGGFRLRQDGAPVKETVWEGKLPKLLLKALIAHGAAAVPKDVLLEDLWPEGDPDGAKNSFQVGLHRLRKALEPGLDKEFGSSYLHLDDGLLSLDPELCRLDVTEFLSLHKAGQEQEVQGNPEPALALYKKAAALYGGDFLPEEPYPAWAGQRREELRGIYLELLDRVSRIYENQGTLGRAIEFCKKAIQADPLLEPAYRRLMTLYVRRGMRAEALRTYEACRQALARELDTEPEAVTTAIFRKIQGTE